MHEGLDVESLSWADLGNVLIGQLLKDGGFARVIQTQYQKSGLRVSLSRYVKIKTFITGRNKREK